MCHVGNGDQNAEASVVGEPLRPDRVVEVTGISPVDGHQLQVAEVGASVFGDGAGCVGFFEGRVGEVQPQLVFCGRDQRNRTDVVLLPQNFKDAGTGQIQPPSSHDFGPDQRAGLDCFTVLVADDEVVLDPLVGGSDGVTRLDHPDNDIQPGAGQGLERAREEAAFFAGFDLGQHPIPGRGRRLQRAFSEVNAGRRTAKVPLDGQAGHVAVLIRSENFQRQHAGQRLPVPARLGRTGLNQAIALQLLQQGLKPDPRAALDAEMLGDRAFVGLLRVLPDKVEDRLPVKVAGFRARRVTL